MNVPVGAIFVFDKSLDESVHSAYRHKHCPSGPLDWVGDVKAAIIYRNVIHLVGVTLKCKKFFESDFNICKITIVASSVIYDINLSMSNDSLWRSCGIFELVLSNFSFLAGLGSPIFDVFLLAKEFL